MPPQEICSVQHMGQGDSCWGQGDGLFRVLHAEPMYVIHESGPGMDLQDMGSCSWAETWAKVVVVN